MKARITCFLLLLAGFASAGKPNILFILADDMGWSDIGCYGGEIPTPNLDRLGYGGMRFTQMHNTSKCFPSRACLLTGLYAQQCGMARSPGKITRAVTLGEALRPAGYRTFAVGKHHGTENLFERGFDHYRGMRDGGGNYWNPGKQREGEPLPAQKRREKRTWCFDEKTVQPYTPKEQDFYSTDTFTDWALELLAMYRDDAQPFLLYLAYQAPHDPLQAWPEDIAKHEGIYDAGYEPIRAARYAKQKKMGLIDETFPLSPASFPDWKSLSGEKRVDEARRMQVYAAMIDCMDRNIGRLLAYLEESGKLDNTLVMFASDNGASAEVVEKGTGEIGSITRWSSQKGDWANVSNTPFRKFKNHSLAGGICTPFIASWPGVIERGAIHRDVCHFVDVMPTLLEFAGGRYPERFDNREVHAVAGTSLAPLLKGTGTLPARSLYWQWGKGRAVYADGYKLVSAGKAWELFDLGSDRTETRDLAGADPERVARMKRLHADWMASHGNN